jgi:hypothetical protein
MLYSFPLREPLYHLPAYASYRIKPVMVKQATEATAEMMT